MTATEKLRQQLDERGIKWGTGFGGDTLWTGRHGIEWRWDKQNSNLAMFTHEITPEQAIEATIGDSDNNQLKAENDKLRELVKSMYHDHNQLKAENDKLRELVNSMSHDLIHYVTDMRALGMEVEI